MPLDNHRTRFLFYPIITVSTIRSSALHYERSGLRVPSQTRERKQFPHDSRWICYEILIADDSDAASGREVIDRFLVEDRPLPSELLDLCQRLDTLGGEV